MNNRMIKIKEINTFCLPFSDTDKPQNATFVPHCHDTSVQRRQDENRLCNNQHQISAKINRRTDAREQ
jgi:hypothetical protein